MLEELNLSDSKIDTIKYIMMANFPRLRKLEIHDNQISSIEFYKNIAFERLDYLDLSFNNIKYFILLNENKKIKVLKTILFNDNLIFKFNLNLNTFPMLVELRIKLKPIDFNDETNRITQRYFLKRVKKH